MSALLALLLLPSAAAAPAWVWPDGWPAQAEMITWSPNGELLVDVDWFSLELRDGRTGARRAAIRAPGGVVDADFFPDGRAVAVLLDKTPYRWDLRSNTLTAMGPEVPKGRPTAIEVSPDGGRLLVATGSSPYDSFWNLYDAQRGVLVASGPLVGDPHGGDSWPPGDEVSWLPGAPSRFVVASGALETHDGATGGLLASVDSPVGALRSVESAGVATAPDRIAVGGLSTQFAVMDLSTGKVVARSIPAVAAGGYMRDPVVGFGHLVWNPDGSRVAGQFEGSTVVILPVGAGEAGRAWRGKPVASLWSADGTTLRMMGGSLRSLGSWPLGAPEPSLTAPPPGRLQALGPGVLATEGGLWRWDGGDAAPASLASPHGTWTVSPSGSITLGGKQDSWLDLAAGMLRPSDPDHPTRDPFGDPKVVAALPAPEPGATDVYYTNHWVGVGKAVVVGLSWKGADKRRVAGLVCLDAARTKVLWVQRGLDVRTLGTVAGQNVVRAFVNGPKSEEIITIQAASGVVTLRLPFTPGYWSQPGADGRRTPEFGAEDPLGMLSPDGKTLYGCDSGDVATASCAGWSVSTGERGATIPGLPLAVSPSGEVLVIALGQGALVGWDPKAGKANWSEPFGASGWEGVWGYSRQGWLVNLRPDPAHPGEPTPLRTWTPDHRPSAQGATGAPFRVAFDEPLPGILGFTDGRGVYLWRMADGAQVQIDAVQPPAGDPGGVMGLVVTAEGGLIQAPAGVLQVLPGGDATVAPAAPGPDDLAYLVPDLLSRFLAGQPLSR